MGARIASPATAVHALVLVTGSIDTVCVVLAEPTLLGGGLTDGRGGTARLVVDRIATRAAAAHADRVTGALFFVSARPAAHRLGVAVRGLSGASVVGARTAGRTALDDAEIQRAGSSQALRVAGARLALEAGVIADRGGPVLRATRVVNRIAGATEAICGALIARSRPLCAVEVDSAATTREAVGIADGLHTLLFTALMALRITRAACTLYAHVAITGSGLTLGVLSAGSTDRGLGVTDRGRGRGLVATFVLLRIAGATATGHAEVQIARSLPAFSALLARATRLGRRVADGGGAVVRVAPRMVDGIAQLAGAADTLVPASGSIGALGVIAADATHQAVGIADGGARAGRARRVTPGITISTEAVDTLIQLSGSILTLIRIETGATCTRGFIADGLGARLDAARSVARVARLAAAVHALVERSGTFGAGCGIVARHTLETRAADGAARRLVAAAMNLRIALAAVAVHALVSVAGSIYALLVIATGHTESPLRVAERLGRRFITSCVVTGIAETTPPVDTLVPGAGPVCALNIGLAGPTGPDPRIADGQGRVLGTAVVISGTAGLAALLHAER